MDLLILIIVAFTAGLVAGSILRSQTVLRCDDCGDYMYRLCPECSEIAEAMQPKVAAAE